MSSNWFYIESMDANCNCDRNRDYNKFNWYTALAPTKSRIKILVFPRYKR